MISKVYDSHDGERPSAEFEAEDIRLLLRALAGQLGRDVITSRPMYTLGHIADVSWLLGRWLRAQEKWDLPVVASEDDADAPF